MSLSLGNVVPDFTADSTVGPLNFHTYIEGSWCVFFSYPRDFSPVCSTEVGMAAKLKPEFDKRNTKVAAISIGELTKHASWTEDFESSMGCTVNFPLVADPKGDIVRMYGMVHPDHAEGVTARSLFIIDPLKKIRMLAVYPTSVGRNFDEVLRIIDSCQFTAKSSLVTPANWQPGDRAIIPPSVSDADAHAKFTQGFESVTSYLRLVGNTT